MALICFKENELTLQVLPNTGYLQDVYIGEPQLVAFSVAGGSKNRFLIETDQAEQYEHRGRKS